MISRGGAVIPAERDAVTRTLPYGHVAAALGTARRDRPRPYSRPPRQPLPRSGLLVGRILEPPSKLAVARALYPATAGASLGDLLALGEVDEDELYTALAAGASARHREPTARRCCTTCRRATWKGIAARSSSVATDTVATDTMGLDSGPPPGRVRSLNPPLWRPLCELPIP